MWVEDRNGAMHGDLVLVSPKFPQEEHPKKEK